MIQRSQFLNLLRKLLQKNELESFSFFLVILSLPTQIGKHFWPSFSYIFSLKIDYLSPTIYFWDLLLLISFTLFLLTNHRLKLKPLFILAFFLITQALFFNASSPLVSLVRLEQFLLAGMFAIYLINRGFNNSKYLISLGLALGVVLESLISFGEFFKGGSLGLWILGERTFSLSTLSIANFNWYGQILLRPYATFPHPNLLGAFIVIALTVLFFVPLKSKNHFVASLGFIAGTLSFSKSVIFLLFFQLLYILRRKLKFFLIFIILLSPFVYIRFNSALNFDVLSITRREELAQIAISQFLSQPLLGVGLNNFILSASSDLISGPNRFLQPVHNIFLLTLAETGLVGLGGFLLFLSYPLWSLKKVKDAKTIFFVSSLFFIIIFLGMFDHYFLTLPQGIRLLFLVWGLSLSLIAEKKVE